MSSLFIGFSRERRVRSVVCLGPGPVNSYGDIIPTPTVFCNGSFRFSGPIQGRFCCKILRKDTLEHDPDTWYSPSRLLSASIRLNAIEYLNLLKCASPSAGISGVITRFRDRTQRTVTIDKRIQNGKFTRHIWLGARQSQHAQKALLAVAFADRDGCGVAGNRRAD